VFDTEALSVKLPRAAFDGARLRWPDVSLFLNALVVR